MLEREKARTVPFVAFFMRAHALGVAVVVLVGCKVDLVKTDKLAGTFNAGAIDTSGGDPHRAPAAARAELVARLVKQELVDGYFAQGEHGRLHDVAAWLDRAADDPERFYRTVVACACARGAQVGEPCPAGASAEGEPWQGAGSAFARAALLGGGEGEVAGTGVGKDPGEGESTSACRAWIESLSGSIGANQASICAAGERQAPALERFADGVRLRAGTERAVMAIVDVLIERAVDAAAVRMGAAQALREAAAYVRGRRWQRELVRPVTGLVVKGGASTGVYSAGVVWVALGLVHRCMQDPDCRGGRDDLRFTLLSGTSTGALISTAADIFNRGSVERDRSGDLDNLARWFTCKTVDELYCVQSSSVLDLADSQQGIVRFDGIEDLLAQNVSCELLRNRSELLSNTVDFRSGVLYAFSDQDPAEMQTPRHVIDGVLASAVLPFIANPVEFLPRTHGPGAPDLPITRGGEPATFLDGGIRSELPVLPLARRGAERVLVVSSAASALGASGRLENALEIVARYIDVSTGGVTESELGHAQRWIESVRLSEIDLCEERALTVCDAADGCDVAALCEGRWDAVCEPASESTLQETASAAESVRERRADRIESLWRMTAFYRDEVETEASHGYAFGRRIHRSLFRAGADAARVRCLEIARVIGIVPDEGKVDAALRRNLVAWCSAPLPDEESLCGAPPRDCHGDFCECSDPAVGRRAVLPGSREVCNQPAE